MSVAPPPSYAEKWGEHERLCRELAQEKAACLEKSRLIFVSENRVCDKVHREALSRPTIRVREVHREALSRHTIRVRAVEAEVATKLADRKKVTRRLEVMDEVHREAEATLRQASEANHAMLRRHMEDVEAGLK